MCGESSIELETEIQLLLEEMAEMEKRYRRLLWILIISSGGQIRVPPSVVRDVEDSGELVVMTDEATGEMLYSAALYTPGAKGL